MSENFEIFLSYKLVDSGSAIKFKELFKEINQCIEVFLSSVSSIMGADWSEDIDKALDRCHMYILIYSGADIDHHSNLYEAGHANARRKNTVCIAPTPDLIPKPLKPFLPVPHQLPSLEKLIIRSLS